MATIPTIASSSTAPPPPPAASSGASQPEHAVAASHNASSEHLGLQTGKPRLVSASPPPGRRKIKLPDGKASRATETDSNASGIIVDFKPRHATFCAPRSPVYRRFQKAVAVFDKLASRPTVAIVDHAAILDNYRKGCAKLGPDVEASVVIKADAYGLGAVPVAKTLMTAGCGRFFVARLGEATQLRQALRAEKHPQAETVKICLLDGLPPGTQPAELHDHNVEPVLNSLAQVRQWNDYAKNIAGKQLPCILQVDTGMSRAGLSKEDVDTMIKAGPPELAFEGIEITHVMTHLAKSGVAAREEGAPNDATRAAGEDSMEQLGRFNEICSHFPNAKQSIGASSTVFLQSDFHKNMVRMGGTVHGQAPFEADTNPLRNTLELRVAISEIRDLEPGQEIGYGLAFQARHDMKVATLPIGYADGLPRTVVSNEAVENGTGPYFLIGEHRAPLLGATSMDMAAIDVTNIPPQALHGLKPVMVIGVSPSGNERLTPDDLGALFGTNASEIQTKFSARIPRHHINQPADAQ